MFNNEMELIGLKINVDKSNTLLHKTKKTECVQKVIALNTTSNSSTPT